MLVAAVPVTLTYEVRPPDLVPLAVTPLQTNIVFYPTSPQSTNVTVVWGVTNRGTGVASANWYDRLYLSTNAVWEAQDYQLGAFLQTQSVTNGTGYAKTNAVSLPQWPGGNYHLVLRVDADNNIYESGESNNTSAVSITLVGASLSFVSASLSGGNGTQTVEPNECNDLWVVVRNVGNSTATNVTATLTTATPGVTLYQPSSPYSDIPAAAMATNSSAFIISTSPSFVCGASVNLTLTLIYEGGTNTLPFSLASGGNYVIAQSSGASIVPGTTDVGNHDDDTVTTISLPFPYTFYGQTFTGASLSANGNLQFASTSADYGNGCLPFTNFNNAILAHWDDLRTDVGGSGIFTSVSGTAPNRIFNIEWRATYFSGGASLNFEARLYEGQERFDVIYGTLNSTGASATVGAQKGAGSAYAQFECNSGGLSNGLQLTFQREECANGNGPCSVKPELTIKRVNQMVEISWPTWASAYALETAQTVNSATSWQAVTNTPVIVGDENVLSVAPTNVTQFYRLRKQ